MLGISSAIHLQATPNLLKLREKCFFGFLSMTQSILSVAIPVGICRAFVMLPGLDGKNLAWGGAFVNSSRRG